MNGPDRESIILTTSTSQYTIAPGGTLEIPVILTNQGRAQEQLRISVEGIPMVWVSTEHQMVLLQPGEQREIILTIKPPTPPNSHIGRYSLRITATSTIDPSRTAQEQVTLTVAGFEVKARVGVLLDGVQYAVTPGDQLAVPVVMINQGLVADTFRPSIEGLPDGWVSIPIAAFRLEPGEVRETNLLISPPRHPDSRASRYTFLLLVASQEAPDQSARIDCTLTVAAFTEFRSSLEAAQPDQKLPAKVLIQNLSNIPVAFLVRWSSPEDSVVFEPGEPQPINITSGNSQALPYTARLKQRPWAGGAKSYPYTVEVQASGQHTQTLDSSLEAGGLLPAWALVAIVVLIALLCVYLGVSLLRPGARGEMPLAETPTLTVTATTPLPTATQSQTDQRPLLIERKWYLVSFNDMRSSSGTQEQEPFNLFNPDGTLIGFTGCKDLSASYQTNYNQISILNINLGPGACSDAALQRQEDALLAILRSARSYFVADTALQIAGDSGFLNHSLAPVYRPEEILPPQAAIRAVPQAEVGQVVIFDGTASSGQVPIVSWNWNFGDGGSASGAVVQHTYINPGTFNVSLVVTDQRSQTGSVSQQIHVLAPPTATSLPPAPTEQPTQVPPTAAPEQPTPTVPAELPTATLEPLPEPIPPQASLLGPPEGFIGEPIEFDASASQPGSSPIVSYNWSFGNGQDLQASPDPRTSTIYNRAGDYEISVFVVDANGLSSIASTRIHIDPRLDTDVWTLSMINTQPLIPATAITMQFKNGEIVGFAGCNIYGGQYTADMNEDGTYTITIGTLTTSRLACPQDIMEQEQEYLTSLQQATRATIQENSFILSSPAGELFYYLIEPR